MQERQTEALPVSDVRKVVRLLGNLAVSGASLADKRRKLLKGLCTIIDADAFIWGVAQHSRAGDQPEYACILTDGFSEAQYAKALEANEHSDMVTLCAPFFTEFAHFKRHLTRHRQQIIPDKVYFGTSVSSTWSEAGVGPVILSFYPLEHGGASAVALYRHHGRQEFACRESRIAHIVLTEVPWLHFNIPGIDTEALRLSRRQRQVMNYLIQGTPRKAIADELGISIHTVAGYCKEIYFKFGVASQVELVRRFTFGDGGDVAATP